MKLLILFRKCWIHTKYYNTLKASFSPEQAEVLTAVVSEAFLDFSKLVTKQEFSELVEAQRRTNETLSQLTVRINELAEAQRRTEQRLNELAEAQKRTEQQVRELTEAQKNTEKRFNELAEAQRRADERFNALNETVKKLAQELVEMRLQFGAEIKDIRQQLGGLAMAVGYGIEDKVMPYFFDLARKDYGILDKTCR